jgi:hypothetical protein
MIRIEQRILICILSAALGLATVSAAPCAWADPAGTESKSTETPPLVEFRRVYVPADAPDQWPHGKTSYLPIRKEEFERLIGRIRSAQHTIDSMQHPRIMRATYYGRYDSGRLVGSANLSITRQPNSSEYLPLARMRTSLSKPRWGDDDPRREQDSRAQVGTSADGSMWLRVKQDGRFRFVWSQLRATSDNAHETFAFAWPACSATSMVIDLPKRFILQCEQGIVRTSNVREKSPQDSLLPVLSSGYQRWHIALGSRRRGELLIIAKKQPADLEKSRVAQHHQYQISPQGLLLITNLRIDARSPIDRIQVRLDPGLQPIYVRHAGQDVRWTLPAGSQTPAVMTVLHPLFWKAAISNR